MLPQNLQTPLCTKLPNLKLTNRSTFLRKLLIPTLEERKLLSELFTDKTVSGDFTRDTSRRCHCTLQAVRCGGSSTTFTQVINVHHNYEALMDCTGLILLRIKPTRAVFMAL